MADMDNKSKQLKLQLRELSIRSAKNESLMADLVKRKKEFREAELNLQEERKSLKKIRSFIKTERMSLAREREQREREQAAIVETAPSRNFEEEEKRLDEKTENVKKSAEEIRDNVNKTTRIEKNLMRSKRCFQSR